MVPMALDTEQSIFIICASLAEACEFGDPFNPSTGAA
jgi:hypothetical protein